MANPQGRDLTYYSMVHNKYSRMDYIFISQRDLTSLKDARIGMRKISDHAPTSVTLRLQDTPVKPCMWRLNSTLLTDSLTLKPISEAIRTYFRENTTDDVSPLTVREAHKCVIRGRMISLASQKKKASEKELKALLDTILILETQHK